MKKIKYLFLMFLLVQTATAQVATGGTYVLDEALMANGGNKASGGTYNLEGTAGNPISSQKLTGGLYSVQGGFNNGPQFVPTAAGLTLSGRAMIGKDRGIKNVWVTLMGGLMTSPKMTRTNAFGHFTFTEVEAGYFYVLQVWHKELSFEPNSRSFLATEDLGDFIFRGNPN